MPPRRKKVGPCAASFERTPKRGKRVVNPANVLRRSRRRKEADLLRPRCIPIVLPPIEELRPILPDMCDLCTVCFENFDVGGRHGVVALACGHIFGDFCIHHWLAVNRKYCPLCNATIKDVLCLQPDDFELIENVDLYKELKTSYDEVIQLLNIIKAFKDSIESMENRTTYINKENERLRNAPYLEEQTSRVQQKRKSTKKN